MGLLCTHRPRPAHSHSRGLRPPEFVAAYNAAVTGQPSPVAGAKAEKGSLKWLVDCWRKSSDWQGTASATRRQRENILHHVLQANGHRPYALMRTEEIIAGRERRMKTPFAANNFLKTMNALFKWAVGARLAKANPAAGVAFLDRQTEGFPPWSLEDVERYRAHWPLGTRQRLAMELLLCTGLRRGDAVRLGRQHVRDGVACLKAEKTGALLYVTVKPILAAVIEAGPTGDLTYIAGDSRRAQSKESFGNFFREWCNAAGVKASAHGLRKLAASLMAEGGATENELQAFFGWTTNSQSLIYTRDANKRKLAKSGSEKLNVNSSIPAPLFPSPAPKKSGV
ncbi:tyrosine-type recombinase/integrase [soil metagenome]